MTRTTITVPEELLNELMRTVHAKSKTEAVLIAIRNQIRIRKLERLRKMAGRMEFVVTAEDMRHGADKVD